MKTAIMAIAAALTLSLPLRAAPDTYPEIEFWECGFFSDEVLVELLALTDLKNTEGLIDTPDLAEPMRAILIEAGMGIGMVKVSGTEQVALFKVTGFDRRWDFGDGFEYAFIISPDGTGSYYDFSTGAETVSPSQIYSCNQVR